MVVISPAALRDPLRLGTDDVHYYYSSEDDHVVGVLKRKSVMQAI